MSWEEGGRVLASSSDDTCVALWSFPFAFAAGGPSPSAMLSTAHPHNILGVKLLRRGEAVAACDLSGLATAFAVRPDGSRAAEDVVQCECDHGPGMHVGASPVEPNLFWVARDSGAASMFDLRAGRPCGEGGRSCAAVLRARLPDTTSLSAVAVSPVSGNALVAFSCSHSDASSSVLLWDARAAGGASSAAAVHPLARAEPPHSAVAVGDHPFAPTHVTFSPDGASLLASFPVAGALRFPVPGSGGEAAGDRPLAEDGWPAPDAPEWDVTLRPEARALLERAAAAGDREAAGVAVCRPYRALALCGRAAAAQGEDHPAVRLARAGFLARRGWSGDFEEASQHALAARRLAALRGRAHARAAVAQASSMAAAARRRDDGARMWGETAELVGGLLRASPRNAALRAVAAEAEAASRRAASEENEPFFRRARPRSPAAEVARREAAPVVLPSFRYAGHSNIKTGIKEARDWGAVVLAGSDDGRLYVYSSQTGELLRTVAADDDIVNAIAPHPLGEPVVAVSGIANSIRVFEPGDEDAEDSEDEAAAGSAWGGGDFPVCERRACVVQRVIVQSLFS